MPRRKGLDPEKHRKRSQKWRELNREKYLAAKRACYQANKERLSEQRRARIAAKPRHELDRYLRINYGLTVDSYESALEIQDGKCAICRKPETRTMPSGRVARLSVDHCHRTGRKRGLLCTRCNHLLGTAGVGGDDVHILANAIAYLHQWGRFTVDGNGDAVQAA